MNLNLPISKSKSGRNKIIKRLCKIYDGTKNITDYFKGNIRGEKESFIRYKERLRDEKRLLKHYLRRDFLV